jgi:hypothetical protein
MRTAASSCLTDGWFTSLPRVSIYAARCNGSIAESPVATMVAPSKEAHDGAGSMHATTSIWIPDRAGEKLEESFRSLLAGANDDGRQPFETGVRPIAPRWNWAKITLHRRCQVIEGGTLRSSISSQPIPAGSKPGTWPHVAKPRLPL